MFVTIGAPPAAAVADPVIGSASVYGVLPDGRLTYTVIDAATGNRTHTVTSTASLGSIVAMATLDFNTLLVTSPGGVLYRVDIQTNSSSLSWAPPVSLGGGWVHQQLAYDGTGNLFGIYNGTLRRYYIGNTEPGHPTASDITGNTLIDSGFTLTTLTTVGPNWILGLTSAGVLRSYRIFGANSWSGYTLDDRFCCFTHLISPGGGVYYGRTSAGAIYRYVDNDPFDGSGADIQSFSSDPVDLSGWTQTRLSAWPLTVAQIPPRTVNLAKPMYFIHGYALGSGGFDCNPTWGPAKTAFNSSSGPGFATGPLLTVAFYEGDYNCDVRLPDDSVNLYGSVSDEGTHNESIKELGREFAWEVYNRYSRVGQGVEVVGWSMGGLIARAALTGTQRNLSGWPPYIFVEDVVTLATPHGGTFLACGLTRQCNEMEPSSPTLDWMNDNPQSDVLGTDWTLLGSSDDDLISPNSAFNMCCVGHKVHYPGGQPDGNGVEHYNIHQRTSGTFHIEYCDYFAGCDMEDSVLPYDTWTDSTGDWSPITMTKYALRSSTF